MINPQLLNAQSADVTNRLGGQFPDSSQIADDEAGRSEPCGERP